MSTKKGNVDHFEEKVLELEERVFHLDIIESFAARGWGLYEIGPIHNKLLIESYFSLKPFVEMGREKEKLEYDKRYVLLPLNKDDTNWKLIQDMIFMLIGQGRGPYFVEFREGIDENGKYVEPIGRFLIDSIYLEPPELVLIIDPRMSNTRDPRLLGNTEIRLHFSELWKIRKCLMMALRKI